ncbi:MAG: hypothetical protein ACYC9M_09730, partial [Desulfobulbaceae bacterium]
MLRKTALKLAVCQLFAGLFCLVFVIAHAGLDAPHNIAGCLSCHQMTSTYPKLLPPLHHTPLAGDLDDTVANDVCWSCHNDPTPLECRECHASSTVPYVATHSSPDGTWTVECWVCHNQHMQEQNRYNSSSYGKFIRRSINLANIKGADGKTFINKNGITKTGIKPVVFIGQEGTNSFADGDSTFNGICEVCHTNTTHHQNSSAGDHNHYPKKNCIECHSHTNGFRHGGGGTNGTGCEQCHGHDPGTKYDPDLTAPYTAGSLISEGRGSFQSHSTHTETDADDLKGPGLYCNDCHDITNFPKFKDGQDLALTTVCDTCHSPGGSVNGVISTLGSVGAKDNWRSGVYSGYGLQDGKEMWCAGCPDNAPANSRQDG